MTYICPVCGYDMEDAPEDYNICPSCGTEFGVNDVNSSVAELRAAWLSAGAPWWSTTDQPPASWNPYLQLDNIFHHIKLWASEVNVSPHTNPLPEGLMGMISGVNSTISDSLSLLGKRKQQAEDNPGQGASRHFRLAA